ncbi:MAG: hypothetical protein GX078_09350 [Clostridiales bacterium]|nr:hypothetical protein [Clostridiales bacterium]
MEKLKKSLELYRLMLERMEKSGHAPHQADYFKECAEFVKTCKTGDEATAKMRKSHLYTAGGDAFALDDVLNRKWAAEKNKEEELIKLYSNRYEEIKNNPKVVMDYNNTMDFTRKVQDIEIKISRRRDNFVQVCQGYFEMKMEIQGSEDYNKALAKLQGGYGKMEADGKPFFEASSEDKFRNLLFIPDEGYKIFVKEVELIIANPNVNQSEEADTEDQWEELKANKEEIKQIGERELKKYRRGCCFCESPKDVNGKYTYEHFVVEEV